MIKAIIIDDERHCVESLYLQLQELGGDLLVLKRFTDPLKALEFIKSERDEIDLLFLDIAMPHLNGFELISKLEDIPFKIIFTTAYDKFAIKAFEFSAFDYLLKPVQDEDLMRVIHKFKTFIQKEQDQKIRFLLDRVNGPNNPINQIAFSTQEGYEIVKVEDISHCKAMSNYCQIHLKNQKVILISKTLKQVEFILSDFGFLRIHKSYLVHPQFIQKIIKTDGGSVVLQNGEQLPISKVIRDQLISTLKLVGRD